MVVGLSLDDPSTNPVDQQLGADQITRHLNDVAGKEGTWQHARDTPEQHLLHMAAIALPACKLTPRPLQQIFGVLLGQGCHPTVGGQFAAPALTLASDPELAACPIMHG